MGTPHQAGSGVPFGKLLVNVVSVFVAADDRLMKQLERDSEWLQQQLGQFGPISGDFVTNFAYEEYKTPTALGHSIMVYSPVLDSSHGYNYYTGCASSIGCCTRCSGRRADRHPCRPHQHGQVWVK